MSPVLARILLYVVLTLLVFLGGVALEHRLAAVRLQKVELVYQKEREAALAKAEAETLQLQTESNQAQEKYAHAVTDLASYIADNPISGVYVDPQTCRVSRPAGTNPRTVSSAPAPGDVLAVLAGNSGVRQDGQRDIGPLLDALGRKADEVNNVAREFQTRSK